MIDPQQMIESNCRTLRDFFRVETRIEEAPLSARNRAGYKILLTGISEIGRVESRETIIESDAIKAAGENAETFIQHNLAHTMAALCLTAFNGYRKTADNITQTDHTIKRETAHA